MRVLLNLIFAIVAAAAFSCSSAYAEQHSWPYRENLQKEIQFWKDIFTKYDDNHYVLHDPEDIGIVYKVVSLEKMPTGRTRERHIALEKYEITKNLLEISKKLQNGEPLSASEKEITRLFGDTPSSHRLKVCAYRVRAQQGISNRFHKGLKRSFAYLPAIKKIFRDNDMPESLAYLPHVESSFNPLARSKSGAVGMWQFIRKTGVLFMKVNKIIDERYDPIASTQGACSLLKLNYKETGDWGLAITAYNHGLTAMAEAGEKYNKNYLEVRRKYHSPSFQFASKNFYPEFLAAVEIMEKPEQYFSDIQPAPVPRTIRYKVKNSVNIPKLAKQCDIGLSELRELNPAYTAKVWQGRVSIPAGYYINMPAKADLAAVNKYVESAGMMIGGGAGDKQDMKAPQVVAAAETKKVREPKKTIRKNDGTQNIISTKAQAVAAVKKTPTQQGEQKPAATAEQQTVTPRMAAAAEAAGKINAEQDGGPVNVTALSLDGLKKELQPVLAVNNKAIKVFGNETMGHYAQWLKVPSQRLFKMNRIAKNQTLRQKQKMRLDFSRVSPEEFQLNRLNHHISSIENMVKQNNLDQLLDYKLREGDSLCKITQDQYKVPTSLILYFNSKRDLTSLHPGAVIRIPVSKARLSDNQNT